MGLNFSTTIDIKRFRMFMNGSNDRQSEGASAFTAENNKRPKVLIIDDDEAIVEAVKYNLTNVGYKVVAHTKSLGAMGAIMDERPDLILLDIKMPLLDGQMLCRLVQKNQLISKTPILLYSSLNEKQLSKSATECKAQDYIHKSSGMTQVIKKVSKYLSSSFD
jgi:two-component system, OmpR family, alkaline phosphatase synthesis response regulator PhoP